LLPDIHHDRVTVTAPIAISGQAISLTISNGLEVSSGALRVKIPANSGLTVDTNGVYVGVSGLGLSKSGGNIVLTSNSNPGVSASILASDASGYLQLRRLYADGYVILNTADAGVSFADRSDYGNDSKRWVLYSHTEFHLYRNSVNRFSFTEGGSISTPGDMSLSPVGDIIVNPAGGEIFFPNAKTLRSIAWTPGLLGSGWGLQERAAGKSHLDIRSIYTDELIATTFIADQVRVRSGSDWLGESLGVAARDNADAKVTIPSVGGGAVRIYLENAPEVTGALFSNNEYVLIKTIDRTSGLIIRETWGQVSSYISETGNRQSWSWTTVSGGGGFLLEPGTALIGFGVSSGGYIFRTVVEAGRGPVEKFGTWSTNPHTPGNRVSRVEIGDIRNAAGDSTTRYGIAAANNIGLTPSTGFSGFTSDSVYGMKLFNTLLEIYSGGARYIRIDTTDGITITPGTGEISKISWKTTGGVQYASMWSYQNAPWTQLYHEVRAASAVSNSSLTLAAKNFAGDIPAQVSIAQTYGDNRGAVSVSADTFAVGKTGTVFEVSANAGANTGTYMVDRAFVVISGTNHQVWHAGNDGSGSGLDADLLDGMQTSVVGDRWGVIPTVASDGVMEVGRYIDFHEADGDTADGHYRLTVTSGSLYTSGGVAVAGGGLSVTTNGNNFNIIGTNHVYMGFYPAGYGTGRKAYFGYGGVDTHDLTLMNEYASGGLYLGTSGVARISISSTGVVTFNASMMPATDIGANSGGASNRWATTYSASFVGGYGEFQGTNVASHINYGANEDTYIRAGKTNSSVYIQDAHAGVVTIASGGGNVRIGSGSSSYKLDVTGDIRTTTVLRADVALGVAETSAPSTSAVYAWLYIDSADGDLKVKFKNGNVYTLRANT
jgi:hypothetical protein